MFLIEHRFCSGALDGKGSNPGDLIGFGAVHSILRCHSVEGTALDCQTGGWENCVVHFASVVGTREETDTRLWLIIHHCQSNGATLSDATLD